MPTSSRTWPSTRVGSECDRMVPSRVKTMSCESSRAGSVIDGGSKLWDCRRNAPATTPITGPSSLCSGMVNMTRASPVRPVISSDTSGLPSTSVRRRASRSVGSRSAAFSSCPARRLRRSSPLSRATCMVSKNCTAGRPCCSSHSSDEGDSSDDDGYSIANATTDEPRFQKEPRKGQISAGTATRWNELWWTP